MIEIISIDADFIARSYLSISVRTLDYGEYQAVITNEINGGGQIFSKFKVSNNIPAEKIEERMNRFFLAIAERQPKEKKDIFYWADFIKFCIETTIEEEERKIWESISVEVSSEAIK